MVHPSSLALNGCYMGFVNGGDGILCGFSEIYLDHGVRLCAGKRILTSDFHQTGKAFVKTTKRGSTSLAIPGYDPPFEITILWIFQLTQDRSPNCWISCQLRLRLYINHCIYI